MTETKDQEQELRIACLEPSATAICLALGLRQYIVGITHECHELVGEEVLFGDGAKDGEEAIRTLTKNGLTAEQMESQSAIHDAVTETSKARREYDLANKVCDLPGDADKEPPLRELDDIPTLYGLVKEEFVLARPTVVFTQDLCSVCAPTTTDVYRVMGQTKDGKATDIHVVSLTPTTMDDVADSYVTVAKACGVEQRGINMRRDFVADLERIQSVVRKYRGAEVVDNTSNDDDNQHDKRPSMLILEWLAPPFDGGHWTYQMMDYAGIQLARKDKDPQRDPKSHQLTWDTVYKTDPDCILVGCCGFDLQRNIRDTWLSRRQLLPLRSCQQSNLYACNGNIYIAQPGPHLLAGTAIMAACAHGQAHPGVIQDLTKLGFLPPREDNWDIVDLLQEKPSRIIGTAIADIEDIAGFAEIHKEACDKGELSYKDPATGFSVMTELAHTNRGKCCGSGCRHCPYSHENVRPGSKASRIQQPAWLVHDELDSEEASSFLHPAAHDKITILSFSGGKDSFLTIRSLAKTYQQCEPSQRFGLVLLTSFDARDRIIANQDIPIDKVVEQAKHLKLSLVGVPLRRSSGETYPERIAQGLAVVRKAYPDVPITMAFGDLHLDHIKAWRDSEMGKFQCPLQYPIWKIPYPDLLDDLDASGVPCEVSASTVEIPFITPGVQFTRDFYTKAVEAGVDGFGENGEFHSLVKVWEVSREQALGIHSEAKTN